MAYGRSLRVVLSCAVLAGGCAAAAMTDAQVARADSTPPLGLQNFNRVQVLCLAAPVERPDAQALQQELCGAAAELAARKAPVPVSRIAFGDPSLLDRSALTLLVHAGIQSDGENRTVALYVRPFRGGGADTETFFVARPRAVRIAASGTGGAPLRQALASSLAEILPWAQNDHHR